MKKTKMVSQKVEEVIAVLCNLCGLTCGPRYRDGLPMSAADDPGTDLSYGAELNYTGGGHSHFVGDIISGQAPTIHLDICEPCIADLCNRAVIKPAGWLRPWMKKAKK